MKSFQSILTILFCITIGCRLIPHRTSQVISTEVSTLEIDEYKITKYKSSLRNGSLMYAYFINKNGKEIGAVDPDDNPYDPNRYSDSCHLIFGERSDYYIQFNLCEEQKAILIDDKVQLDYNIIDSITLRPLDTIITWPNRKDSIIIHYFDITALVTRLNEVQMKVFVKYWNESTPFGYKQLGNSFEWLVTVYSKGNSRKYKIIDQCITENGNWSYKINHFNKFSEAIWK